MKSAFLTFSFLLQKLQSRLVSFQVTAIQISVWMMLNA